MSFPADRRVAIGRLMADRGGYDEERGEPMVVLVLLGCAALWLVALFGKGLRDGDRPDDVLVRVRRESLRHLDGDREIALVHLVNPGRGPVLVGLSVRPARLPAWLTQSRRVCTPLRTTSHHLAAGEHEVVGVVDRGAAADFVLPVAGRCLVRVVAGQHDGRLRLTERPVPQPSDPGAGDLASHQPLDRSDA